MVDDPADQREMQRDDLIDRLRAFDIRYLGGSAWAGWPSAYERGDPFPIAYRAAWEDVGRHVLDDLREEQRDGAA